MRRREFITPLGNYGEPCPLQRLRGRANYGDTLPIAVTSRPRSMRGMAGIGRIVTPPSDAAPGCTSHVSTPMVRFHHGKARINSRLGSIGGLDADGWEFPPQPKW
jgi:hypothetical protein